MALSMRNDVSSRILDISRRSIAIGVTTAGASLASRLVSSLFHPRRAKKATDTPFKSAVTAGATAALSNQLSECTTMALNGATQSHGVLNNMAAAAVSAAVLSQLTHQQSLRRVALAPVHMGLSSMLFTEEPLHSRLPLQINKRYFGLRQFLLDPPIRKSDGQQP